MTFKFTYYPFYPNVEMFSFLWFPSFYTFPEGCSGKGWAQLFHTQASVWGYRGHSSDNSWMSSFIKQSHDNHIDDLYCVTCCHVTICFCTAGQPRGSHPFHLPHVHQTQDTSRQNPAEARVSGIIGTVQTCHVLVEILIFYFKFCIKPYISLHQFSMLTSQ